MIVRRHLLGTLASVSIAGPGLVFLNGCAGLAGEPLRVSLVDLTSQPGQGLEWRMLARLRVQNPSGSEIRYEGLSVELTLRGQPFASGVAPLAGSIKPYSEAVLQVPLSVSGLAMLRQVLDLVREFSRDTPPGTAVKAPALPYSMRGRLGGFGGPSFESSGVVELPEFTASRPEVGTPAPK